MDDNTAFKLRNCPYNNLEAVLRTDMGKIINIVKLGSRPSPGQL